MKLPSWFLRIFQFTAMVVFITAFFSGAFFLTAWIYHAVGYTPSPLIIQLTNAWGGLLIAGVTINALTRFFRPKIMMGEMRIFAPVLDALERIAKGDFSVRVGTPSNRGIIGELVNSVNQMALELEKMEAMRQEFISDVSHEIQSPLASIRGFAQVLQNDHLSPDERHHYLTIIETESMRLSKLADNMLKLAALETEHVKVDPKPYRLDKQLRTLILTFEPQWTAKNQDLQASLDEISITADEDLMSQVWINLIHNSIKFTPDGGSIAIDLHHWGDQIEFKIADTGIGIAEEHQTQVFDRFYKTDKSRERAKEGSGLGLSIVKKTIEMHKGTIRLESKLGLGTTFTVYLPAN